MTNLTRRSFFGGMGAAIVAAALSPQINLAGLTPSRVLPDIRLTIAQETLCTVDYLQRCVADLYSQVAAMAGLDLSSRERDKIADQINSELSDARPAGVQILVETSVERMISGDFRIEEAGFGTILIT